MTTVDKEKEWVHSEARVGMPKRKSQWPNTPAKWIELLGTPLTILVAVAGLLVGLYQFNIQQLESAQMQATQVAVSAAQSLDQQHQTTLDTYFDRMSDLLLTYHLLASQPGDEVRALAQARTYTALRNLDGTRKGTLVRFLWGAGLINGLQPFITMLDADLGGTMLGEADLSGINLSCAILACSNLSGQKVCADLSGAYLCGTELTLEKGCANLSGAYLDGADLSGAILCGIGLDGQKDCANLSGAHLEGVNLHNETNLRNTLLQGAHYNTKPFQLMDPEGFQVTLGPTLWPQGFNPQSAGATCDDC